MLVDAFNRVIEQLPTARLALYGGSAMFAYAVVKLYRHDHPGPASTNTMEAIPFND